MNDKRFYSVNELTELFGVTRTTIYEWMNTGKLPYVIVGARRRVTREALNAFVQAGGGKQDADGDRTISGNTMPALVGAS